MPTSKKDRKALAKARGEARALRSMCPQSRLRRFLGDGVSMGSAYGGSRGYTELMFRGAMPDFPIDGVVGALLRIPASMRWLGGASDAVREVSGGIVEGALGRLGAFHALGIQRTEAGTWEITKVSPDQQ